MKFEFSETKYLMNEIDSISLGKINNLYSALRNLGYHQLDTSYDKKAYISEENLYQDFDPIENTANILYNNKNNFSLYYVYWKHKFLDLYIGVSKQEYDENVAEDLDINNNFYKVTVIHYNPENDLTKIVAYLDLIIIRRLSSKNKIDIIIQSMKGFEFIEHEIKSPNIDLDTMYNEDFKPVYNHIVDKLNTANRGVVLFYGEPGTGKTSLIKHLTTVVKDKFVFVPISMIAHVSSPQFIGDLVKNKGGILVLEDCENFIQNRKLTEDSVVSPLLQITDGILSDMLEIKIICTFNTDLTKVDEALRREGRLIAEYEFKELTDDRAEILAGKPVKGKKTLANIFNNLTYKESKKEEKLIGFGR